jgi:carboxyl-terminal processing protease
MKRWLRIGLILVAVIVVLGLGLAGGVALDRQVLNHFVSPDTVPANAEPEFRLMAEAWNTLQENYVDRQALDPQKEGYGAISGMVDSLGDTGHSRFLSPDMVQQNQGFLQGEFEGIGAYVQMKDGHVIIAAPMDGSPAQEAGLRPGDVILKVNGEDVSHLAVDEVVGRILGPAGTQVTLTILSPGTGQTRDVTLTRAQITVHNVSWQRLPGTDVAHLRIASFSQGVTDDLQQALTEIRQQGLSGIVLDLRSNPGGLLNEVVDTASQFLASGNVLLEKDAQGKVTPVPIKEGGLALDLPMVVLINEGTASAAEILAGALQDAGRAQLVGATTFGTGTVLGQFNLSDGSALLVATQEWLTPKGRVIWHKGIAPDVAVALPQNVSPLLPEAEAGMTADELNGSGDDQLLKALELLTSGSVATPPETSSRTVTLDNDGGTIDLKVGEQFLLKLGEDYNWTITVADPSVVSRVVNITVVRGAQGVYEAHQPGSTRLTATGDPVCRRSQPPCAAPSRLFQMQIIVE